MKNLLHSKDHSRSSSQANSSRSSSVTSGTDSGVENSSVDGDVKKSGPTMSEVPMTGKTQAESSAGQSSKHLPASVRTNFRVEHLASFPIGPGDKIVSAKKRLEKAKELIAKGEPWTKEMELSVTDHEVVLFDLETQQLIERYPLSNVDSVEDISDDPLLKSVLVFSTLQTPEKYAAVHLFQCDKVPANVIVPEIQKFLPKRKTESPKMNGQVHGIQVLPPPPDQPAPMPPQDIKDLRQRSLVAQGVAAFSAAVAHKMENVPRPPSSPTKVIHGERYGEVSSPDLMEAYINRDVQVLNHCIDDIEELVYKVKQVGEAWKQHEAKVKGKKAKSRRRDFEAIEARSPTREDFIDAFQKCKYSFILLGKLRSHIQNPNAAELVHYLIMPLSLLVRCTKGPQQASVVVVPLMTSESVDLLRSCLTTKEAELWHSLGPAWTLSRSDPHWSNKPVPHYEPTFRSGWVPPEIVGSGRSVPADVSAAVAANAAARAKADQARKDDPKSNPTVLTAAAKFKSSTGSSGHTSPPESPSKGAIFKRIKALYAFTGNNPKELSVNQGEELMILDDSRQWWCVRNSSGAVGFVPNTILNKSASIGSSAPSLPSSATLPTPPSQARNGHIHRQGSSSSDSSIPVFSNQSSLSQEGFARLNNKSESPKFNGGSSFEHMITSKAGALKKVEDISDGSTEKKRLSSTDMLNDELRNKISSDSPRMLSPVSIGRSNSQESAIILRKQSTALEVQSWMKSKQFSNEAMNAVKLYSADELSKLTKNDISHLVGHSEGKKLYTQLTIEKSGDCWQQIVVHRGVSELQAVMNRRKNKNDVDEPSERDQGIRSIVKAAQSDRHDTWIERKLTKRSSLENLQDFHDKKTSANQELTHRTSYELRKRPEASNAPPTAPRVAPKPRPHTVAAYVPPPPSFSQFTGEPPAPILNPSDQKVDDLLREHQRQQELLKEQQRQLNELRAQQKQKEEIIKYEESRIRLEQQVKDQEAMLKLLQEQQKHHHTQAPPQLQPNITAAIQPNIAGTMQPHGAYVSYVPVQAMPGMQMSGVQGYPAAQPIYTIPQVYGAMPPSLGYQQK